MANLGDQEVALEFQSIFDPQTCTRRGMCPVARESFESHSLYFEVHGSGPQKIIFIMGMNHTSFAWLSQVEHFSKLEQYTTLVFDNRGVGLSGSPWGPYSTSGMAEDTICLLDYLQWTEDRSLHVVGISLGGMIAQELAYRIPNRIMSLSLLATRAGGGPWANIPSSTRFMLSLTLEPRLLTTSDLEKIFTFLEGALFPTEWLDSLAEDDPDGRTNREVQRERFCRMMEITKPQTLTGALGQMAALVTHSMSPERLARVSASVPKVLIISAAEDTLIPAAEGENLKRRMPEAEYQCWEKTGHAVFSQYSKRCRQLLEKVFEEGREATGERADSICQ
ncbi:Alpha/Beta hydrolase protein [Boletus reticuloceps]|uniref:Alpha/Beta hydrolase protein n=1 Tax=Boletus reticuloceps TaxID=495285 RepID=A0A8I2YPM9_9AGAM|nr:Alpha/Beta hydrolase protein [Boletus reticuloceps]